jgi:hypothetical protein
MFDGETPDLKRDPFLGCNRQLVKREVPQTRRRSHGWILLNDDSQKIFSAIDAARRYGVERIELSHSIIKNVDPLLDDEDLVALVNEVVRRAGEIEVHLWAHELNEHPLDVCFPDPDAFAIRQEVYRKALPRVPGVAGIVFTLDSTDVNPWEARCRCEACAGPDGPLYTPDPPTRAILLLNALSQTVHEELGRQVWVRTFGHHPWQLEWMGAALRDAALHPAVKVISKEVPQDWQPYYPDNPVIGRVGDREQLVELDVAGEYWGMSVTPAVMIDYLAWRLPRLLRHSTGVTVRIERRSHSVLGTVNEANLFAVSRLLARPPASRQQIWDEWLDRRYRLKAGSEAAVKLREILADTFRISMQTHYLLGLWALTKGSDLPESARELKQLDKRSHVRWAEGWEANHAALVEPDETTLDRIWQEKTEAVARARANLAALEGIRPQLAQADADELADRLARQEAAARAWRLAADVAVRYQRWLREKSRRDQRLIQQHQAALLDLADEIEERWSGRDPLPSPERIRRFARSLPGRFLWPRFFAKRGPDSPIHEPPLILDVEVRRAGAAICAEWRSTVPGRGHLAHAADPPEGLWMPAEFVAREPSAGAESTRHRACIPAPAAGFRLLLRPEVELGDGRTLVASPTEMFD